MKRRAARLVHTLAIVLVVAALVPAVASAGHWGPGTPSRAGEQPSAVQTPLTTCHQYCDTVPGRPGGPTAGTLPPPQIVTVVARSGFSWSDAAIGFGTACGLALVAFGALAYRRHGAVHELREPA